LPKSLIIKIDWGLDEAHTGDEKTALRSTSGASVAWH
jgi:hypothetical protein